MNPEEDEKIVETEVDDMLDNGMDEVVGDVPTVIDLVMDGKASEAKQAIYTTLYQKVGDRIDAMKSDAHNSIIDIDTKTGE